MRYTYLMGNPPVSGNTHFGSVGNRGLKASFPVRLSAFADDSVAVTVWSGLVSFSCAFGEPGLQANGCRAVSLFMTILFHWGHWLPRNVFVPSQFGVPKSAYAEPVE